MSEVVVCRALVPMENCPLHVDWELELSDYQSTLDCLLVRVDGRAKDCMPRRVRMLYSSNYCTKGSVVLRSCQRRGALEGDRIVSASPRQKLVQIVQ